MPTISSRFSATRSSQVRPEIICATCEFFLRIDSFFAQLTSRHPEIIFELVPWELRAAIQSSPDARSSPSFAVAVSSARLEWNLARRQHSRKAALPHFEHPTPAGRLDQPRSF